MRTKTGKINHTKYYLHSRRCPGSQSGFLFPFLLKISTGFYGIPSISGQFFHRKKRPFSFFPVPLLGEKFEKPFHHSREEKHNYSRPAITPPAITSGFLPAVKLSSLGDPATERAIGTIESCYFPRPIYKLRSVLEINCFEAGVPIQIINVLIEFFFSNCTYLFQIVFEFRKEI